MKQPAWIHWGRNPGSKIHFTQTWPSDPNEPAPAILLVCGRVFNRDRFWQTHRGPSAQIGIWMGKRPDSFATGNPGTVVICKRCQRMVRALELVKA